MLVGWRRWNQTAHPAGGGVRGGKPCLHSGGTCYVREGQPEFRFSTLLWEIPNQPLSRMAYKTRTKMEARLLETVAESH